jgi:hypothetical protein
LLSVGVWIFDRIAQRALFQKGDGCLAKLLVFGVEMCELWLLVIGSWPA